MPKTIAITSEKGGVGKSTLAIHLAGALAERGLLVALIDEDARIGSSSCWAKRAQQESFPFEVWEPNQVHPQQVAKLDALIIDTEGRPKRKELRQLVKRADQIILPSSTSALELEATKELFNYLKKETSAIKKIRIVLTRIPPVGGISKKIQSSLRDSGYPVCNSMIRKYAVYQKAAELGILINNVPDTRSMIAWKDIVSFSREII